MAVMDTIERIVFGKKRDEEQEEFENGEYGEYEDSERDSGYYDEEDGYEEETDDEPVNRGGFSFGSFFRGNSSRAGNRSSRGSYSEPYDAEDREPYRRSYGGSSYSSYTSEKKDSARIVLVRGTRFADAKRVAENLRQNRSIVVNFEDMDKAEAQRTMDFLSGTTFAKGGDVEKLSKCTYIFAVGPVDIIGSIEKRQETDEYFAF